MKDLNIRVGGPRDHARQQVSFHIQQAGNRAGWDPQQVGQLLTELRTAIQQCPLPEAEARRIERHLATIEDESQSATPLMEEIHSSLTSLQRLVQSAQNLAPALLGPLRALTVALGLAI